MKKSNYAEEQIAVVLKQTELGAGIGMICPVIWFRTMLVNESFYAAIGTTV